MRKLAIIRQSYRPDGGAERIIQRVIQGLEQAGSALDVTLITQQWQGDSNQTQLLKVPKRGFTRTSRFNNFISQTQALLQAQHFDLVQSHERVPGCQLYRAGDGVHAEWLRIRAEHLGRLGRWWQERDAFHQAVLQAEKQLFEHPNLQAVICNAEQIQHEILTHYPKVAPQILHLVRNGLDMQQFMPPTATERKQARKALGLRSSLPVAVFVGSGFERKGLALLLQTFVRVPYWQLLVVGQDRHLPNYKKICAQWGLGNRVQFLGVLNDVRPIYRAADVLVHPAWYDPAPNVILEAMAMGLPVITSEGCGNKELIDEGVNGFVVSSRYPKQLSEVLNGKHDWRLLGNAARAKVQPYTIERMLDELNTVYRTVLGV